MPVPVPPVAGDALDHAAEAVTTPSCVRGIDVKFRSNRTGRNEHDAMRSLIASGIAALVLSATAAFMLTDGAGSSTTAVSSLHHDARTESAGVLPPIGCPVLWRCTDVGGALPPGRDDVGPDGTWSEVGGGGDIWGTADAFHFVSQPLSGDGTVTARVTSQQDSDPSAKAGVMLRDSTEPGSAYYAVFVTPGHGLAVQWRASAGGSSHQLLAPGGVPLVLMVARYTSSGRPFLSTFTSTDGVTWRVVPGSTVPLSLARVVLGGLAITSHDQGTGSAVTFDDVSVAPGEVHPPGVCPATWRCTDIGGALPPGRDLLSNGTWSEVGGGGDIWGRADAFRFVSQPLSGDGTVTARVTSQQDSDPSAKAGVMLRDSTEPGSAYYAVFVTPGHGVAVQWRASAGGSSHQLLAPGGVPLYLRVARYTTAGSEPVVYDSAFTSSDGVSWNLVPGSTMALALEQNLLGGIAVTSHVQGTGGAVTLSSVAVAAGEFAGPDLACPTGWSCADIGRATPVGGQVRRGGTWLVSGGGGDIWGSADAFHYDWRTLPGDGAISARVSSQRATDPSAKAGVMLRASIDPGAAYYAAFVTRRHGLTVQVRTAAGLATTQLASAPGRVPLDVRVTRSGTNYSAWTSFDGVHWSAVAGSTTNVPALTGTLLGGLAVTAHDTTVTSTATFAAVSLLRPAGEPTVAQITPTVAATRSRFTLRISGSGFERGAIVIVAASGGAPPKVHVVSTTRLKMTVRLGRRAPPGSRDVMVLNPDGGAVTCNECLIVMRAPQVDHLRAVWAHNRGMVTRLGSPI
jgi:hypothetical protein